jgi:hypothetical protein
MIGERWEAGQLSLADCYQELLDGLWQLCEASIESRQDIEMS